MLPLGECVCHIFEGFWSGLLELVVYKLKGWRHNRLMSNFWPFFIFVQICLSFGIIMSNRLIGKHLSFFFSLVFSFFF